MAECIFHTENIAYRMAVFTITSADCLSFFVDGMPVIISTQVDGTVAMLKLQGKFVFSDHRDFRQAVKAQL